MCHLVLYARRVMIIMFPKRQTKFGRHIVFNLLMHPRIPSAFVCFIYLQPKLVVPLFRLVPCESLDQIIQQGFICVY